MIIEYSENNEARIRWKHTSTDEWKTAELDDLILAYEKIGKWFDKGSLSCRCSECGCKSPKEYKYCPNCGARMVE